jgi:hypothetical protein
MMIKRKLRGNKRMTREQKAKEELEWRRVNEDIEIELEGELHTQYYQHANLTCQITWHRSLIFPATNVGIEPMLDSYVDYATDTMGTVMTPVTYVCLYLFLNETEIPAFYNILGEYCS